MSLKSSRSTNARIAGSFAAHETLERFGERAAVEELGQRVGRGLAREPLLAVSQLLFAEVALVEGAAHDPQHGGEESEPDGPEHVRLVDAQHGAARSRAGSRPRPRARPATHQAQTEAPVDAVVLRQHLHREDRVRDRQHRTPAARVQD